MKAYNQLDDKAKLRYVNQAIKLKSLHSLQHPGFKDTDEQDEQTEVVSIPTSNTRTVSSVVPPAQGIQGVIQQARQARQLRNQQEMLNQPDNVIATSAAANEEDVLGLALQSSGLNSLHQQQQQQPQHYQESCSPALQQHQDAMQMTQEIWEREQLRLEQHQVNSGGHGMPRVLSQGHQSLHQASNLVTKDGHSKYVIKDGKMTRQTSVIGHSDGIMQSQGGSISGSSGGVQDAYLLVGSSQDGASGVQQQGYANSDAQSLALAATNEQDEQVIIGTDSNGQQVILNSVNQQPLYFQGEDGQIYMQEPSHQQQPQQVEEYYNTNVEEQETARPRPAVVAGSSRIQYAAGPASNSVTGAQHYTHSHTTQDDQDVQYIEHSTAASQHQSSGSTVVQYESTEQSMYIDGDNGEGQVEYIQQPPLHYQTHHQDNQV